MKIQHEIIKKRRRRKKSMLADDAFSFLNGTEEEVGIALCEHF